MQKVHHVKISILNTFEIAFSMFAVGMEKERKKNNRVGSLCVGLKSFRVNVIYFKVSKMEFNCLLEHNSLLVKIQSEKAIYRHLRFCRPFSTEQLSPHYIANFFHTWR